VKSQLECTIAVIEDLIGQVHAAHIRTSHYKTTKPIAKLYPLEMHSKEYGRKNDTTVPGEIEQSVDSTPKGY